MAVPGTTGTMGVYSTALPARAEAPARLPGREASGGDDSMSERSISRDGDFVLRGCREADSEDLVSLFQRSFEGNGATFAPSTLARWTWRYRANPAGNRSCLAAHHGDGRAVGHVGGVPHATWFRGAELRSVQSVDNMVDPALRRGLQRVGLFAKLVNHWIDDTFDAGRCFLGWGFPTPANFRMGQRFSKYSLLRPVNVLVHAGGELRGAPPTGLEAVRVARFTADLDGLWRRTAPQFELAVARTAERLNWRYADHPTVVYALVEVRDRRDASLRGAAVLRRGGLAPDAALIVDWLAPRDDDEAVRALLEACRDYARGAGLDALVAWFPESVPEFRRFQEAGFHVRDTPILMVGRSWRHDLSIADVRRDLYATLGEIDYL